MDSFDQYVETFADEAVFSFWMEDQLSYFVAGGVIRCIMRGAFGAYVPSPNGYDLRSAMNRQFITTTR